MTIHRIRRGDTLPPLRATLTGQDGAAITLDVITAPPTGHDVLEIEEDLA